MPAALRRPAAAVARAAVAARRAARHDGEPAEGLLRRQEVGTVTARLYHEQAEPFVKRCHFTTNSPPPVVDQALDQEMVSRYMNGDTVQAIRARVPDCRVEVLVSDFKGDDASLQVVFDARPDVFNHNIETVARLQRAVRPSASYARSLSVLARAAQAGLVTKSSIIVGMGETDTEIVQTMADLAAIDCDIVTIGQYLRPTSHHLPVVTWWPPSVFGEWKQQGEAMGIDHVEASPLTRSSYHAREAADAAERG